MKTKMKTRVFSFIFSPSKERPKTAEQSKIQELFWIILELFGIICRDKDFRLTDPSPKQSKRVQIWTVQTSPI